MIAVIDIITYISKYSDSKPGIIVTGLQTHRVAVQNLLIICREKNIITSLVALGALWGIINGQTDPQIILTAHVVMGLLIGGILWDTGKKVLKK